MASLIAVACERNNLEQSLADCEYEVSYIKSIAPLFELRCSNTNCHNSQSTIGNFRLYDEIKLRVNNGKIKHYVFDLGLMPPDEPLSEMELNKIKCWIDQGANK